MSILSELKKFNECQHILKFYGRSNFDDDMLIFEWASLGSLKNVYEKKKIPWNLKAKIAHDICQGLLFLSHLDIFHRDVRCENIMMTHYMEPKIANFYFAKHVSEIGLDNKDHISNHISNVINWSAPEMMQNNALYTQECEVFSFVMLLWELAFQKIPYENMSKEEIVAHVTRGRRETPNLPFYTLDLLNIQRKYLRIVAEGWDNKPEKRIRMGEILLKFSDIEAELNNKSKKNKLESVGRSTRNPRNSISDDRRHSLRSPNSISDSKRYSLQSPNSISDYRRYSLQPSNSISDYKRNSLQLKSKENLAPNLESVGEYTSYAMKSPTDFDSFMINQETWEVERPSNIELSNDKAMDNIHDKHYYETTQSLILDKHIEDIISDDKEPDQTEKEVAFIIAKESVTPEICKAITSTINYDGCIELNEEVCKELDLSTEEVIDAVNNITNKKLKSPELFSTAIILSYLKNVAPKFEGQWKNKYNKAHEYLSKQIGDAYAEKELLVFTDNYVINKYAKKAIKDKKRSAIVDIQTSTTPDKHEAAVSKQKDDGSFELNETICKELEVPMKDIVNTIKLSTNNKKLQSLKSDSWWKTALIMSYLQVAAPYYESQWEDKYNKAREYLSKQIGDANIENELLKCTNKYVIDRAYEKVIHDNYQDIPKLDFTEETHQKVHEDLHSVIDADATRTICNTQREDSSFTVKDTEQFKIFRLNVDDETRKAVFDDLRSNGTADLARSLCSAQESNGSFSPNSLVMLHPLIPSPASAVESLKCFVGSTKLRTCVHSIWHTAFTIYYFKNVLVYHEKEWQHAYDRANNWMTEQIDDVKTEKELYSACEQYLIQQGVDFINSRGGIELEDQEDADVVVLQISEETRKAVYKCLRDDVTEKIARTLCNSQESNGSFSLHKSISDHLKINSIEFAIETLRSYVGSSFLRSCNSYIWCTAFTITYLRTVLADYEKVCRSACERATTWINQQCKNSEVQKELYSACDEFLIKQGIEVLNEKSGHS
ncbi:hypothetical protein C2G38_2086696 [Gigaspora rosea]|uniref:Protein kinase domain-containing protein n=1 Tax=Gigaspora rosea TaxID=44941 RepID=A0A397VFF0_9GLOM|nr:hypothetical protein C2G38_2086696 [Gigaspora rosea]